MTEEEYMNLPLKTAESLNGIYRYINDRINLPGSERTKYIEHIKNGKYHRTDGAAIEQFRNGIIYDHNFQVNGQYCPISLLKKKDYNSLIPGNLYEIDGYNSNLDSSDLALEIRRMLEKKPPTKWKKTSVLYLGSYFSGIYSEEFRNIHGDVWAGNGCHHILCFLVKNKKVYNVVRHEEDYCKENTVRNH